MSKMFRLCVLLLIFQNIFLPIIAQSVETQNITSSQCNYISDSCADCLNYDSACSWCYDVDFDKDRCDVPEKLSKNECKHIYTGTKSKVTIERDEELRDVTGRDAKAVQIKPQRVKLTIRPGHTETIKLKYRLAKNYPLDLYYLIDSTYSMKDDVKTIVKLGDDISSYLKNLTEYFRLGFGVYSDKVEMPFSKMSPESLLNPCSNSDEGHCTPPFNFKHKYALNYNVTEFFEKINSTKVTGNLDNAEGALDALMQILVCTDSIGWQQETRKLIIVLTDGLLHFAGDGKLAGIIKKSDGACHLNENGTYDASIQQDYPSLEEIYRKLKKNKVNVIFAVTKQVYNHYKKLNNVIPSYSYVTELSTDSSNILDVIRHGYLDAVSTVEFQDNARHPLNLEYYSKCHNLTRNQTHACYDVKEGIEYEFDIKVTLESCPQHPHLWNQKIIIDETHLDTESLVIDVEMLCDCKCQKFDKESSRFKCKGNGVIECGICKCDSGWAGNDCSCDISNFESNRDLDNQCRQVKDNIMSSMCSSRGDCICGKCDCEKSYVGKYCECRRCQLVEGGECGGVSRGVCDCGTCLCKEGYTGEDCTCPLDTESCRAPGSELECSGHGQCKCGKCECKSEPFKYSGHYCEKCPTCDGLCSSYDSCARCTIKKSCIADECDVNITNSVDFVRSLDDGSNECNVKINNEFCPIWRYTYDITEDDKVNLKILMTSCEPAITTTEWGIGTFTVVVVLGILTLILYKIIRRMEDKRIIAKFEKEKKEKTVFSEQSPYFKSPVTEYVLSEIMKDQ